MPFVLGNFYGSFEIICCFLHCATYGTRIELITDVHSWALEENRYSISSLINQFWLKLTFSWFLSNKLLLFNLSSLLVLISEWLREQQRCGDSNIMIIPMIIINYSLWKHKVALSTELMRAKLLDSVRSHFLLPYGRLYHMLWSNCFENAALVFNVCFN